MVQTGANSSRNAIDQFDRRFKVQHLLRTLYSRYAVELHRCKGRIKDALAEYLDFDVGTIKRDWRFLDEQLGGDWLTLTIGC